MAGQYIIVFKTDKKYIAMDVLYIILCSATLALSILVCNIAYIIIALLALIFTVYKLICDYTQQIELCSTVDKSTISRIVTFKQDIVNTGKFNVNNIKNIEISRDSIGIKIILHLSNGTFTVYNKYNNMDVFIFAISKHKKITFVKDRDNELKAWFDFRFNRGKKVIQKLDDESKK